MQVTSEPTLLMPASRLREVSSLLARACLSLRKTPSGAACLRLGRTIGIVRRESRSVKRAQRRGEVAVATTTGV